MVGESGATGVSPVLRGSAALTWPNGQHDSTVKELRPRIGMLRALRSQTSFGPVRVREQMARLHRGDHLELLEAQNLLRRGDLRVLNTQPVIGSAVRCLHLAVFCRLLRLGKGVEPQLFSFFTDGMAPNLISLQQPLFRHR